MAFPHIFATYYPSISLSDLDANFSQLSSSSTSTVSLAGAALIGFLQSGSGAVARTSQAKLREVPQSPEDREATTGTDDTTAIQNCVNDGRQIQLVGPYVVTSTIDLTTAAAHGLIVFGNGPQSGSGTGTNKTVITPSAAVSEVFKIDGSGISLAIQNAVFRNFTIDMTNMTDASTSIAFRQMSAYGMLYENVHVINDGTSKRSWKLESGAFTTTLSGCKGNIIELAGTSGSKVTTLVLINHDFAQLVGVYGDMITFIGGAVQGSLDKLDLTNCADIRIFNLDVEGTGTYLKFGSGVSHVISCASLNGFSGTYSSGSATGFLPLDFSGSQVMGPTGQTAGWTFTDTPLKNTKTGAALHRTTFENTNATAEQVDLEFKSTAAGGSSYFGQTNAGKAMVDARGGGGFGLQVGGVDMIAVDASSVLTLGTTTASTATNGGGEAMKANVAGYLVFKIGATTYKIPYVAN